jgi:hypothetical protein
MTLRHLLQRIDERWRMRDDEHLRALGSLHDEAAECGKQIRMKAGFGLVQDEQSGRPRCQQCGDP